MACREQAQALRSDQGLTFDGLVSAKESEVTPAQVRAKLAELRALCMSNCVMSRADRYDHYRSVAIVRARDDAHRTGGPQIALQLDASP